MKKIKILIVDDHPMMREALSTALQDETDMEVCGLAANGKEALRMTGKHDPDVVLMDLLMPGMDGLEAMEKLQKTNPRSKVMAVSSMEGGENIIAAIQAGALGYFPKTAPRSYLLEAIRKVADGIPYMPSGIALILFQSIREMHKPLTERRASDEPLTRRQKEILALLGPERSDLEISQILNLSVATLRSHIQHMMQRLNLETCAQVVSYAKRLKGL